MSLGFKAIGAREIGGHPPTEALIITPPPPVEPGPTPQSTPWTVDLTVTTVWTPDAALE